MSNRTQFFPEPNTESILDETEGVTGLENASKTDTTTTTQLASGNDQDGEMSTIDSQNPVKQREIQLGVTSSTATTDVFLP